MTWLKGVFWDVDGTLANTEMEGHRPAFNRAFADLGLAINWEPELYERSFGRSTWSTPSW